nr:hypothetical protein [uncultured Bacteroides sp.]
MIKNISKLACLTVILLLASCIKEGFDKENCPGEFFITPSIPEGLTPEKEETLKSGRITIIDSEGNEQEVNVDNNNPIDLDDGSYTIVALKGPKDPNVNVSGTNVTIATKPDGSAQDMPENMTGGHTVITVSSNASNQDNTNIEVPTHIQSRPLDIKVKFEGGNAAILEILTGIVDGISLSRDLNNGFAPTDGVDRHPALESGSMNYTFGKVDGDDILYTDSHRLLGIDGDGNQTLTLTVTYAGGVQKTYTFDITTDMDGFHTEDVNKPWVIEITLRLGADFEATIEDWQAGPETWMDAH